MLRSRGNAAPKLSAERQALAEAITARNAAQSELDALTVTAGSWDSPAVRAVREAQKKVDDAPAVLEKAKADAATFFVEQGQPPAISIKAAREAAQLAADDLEAATSARKMLEARLRPAADALHWKQRHVDAALSAVLRAETKQLVEETENLQRELWKKNAALAVLNRHAGLDMANVTSERGSEFSVAKRVVIRMSQVPVGWGSPPHMPPISILDWDQAISALQHDAAAPLPCAQP